MVQFKKTKLQMFMIHYTNLIQPWHDFAYIEWRTSSSDKSDDVTVIPGRILFFFSSKFLTIAKGKIPMMKI
jgi:hypothetical protein